MTPRGRPPTGACELVWTADLTEEEREVYRRAGYHQTFGLGEHPALLIVDVEYNFIGDVDEPILASVGKYPNSCGPSAWSAIPVIGRVLASARAAAIPVAFTHGIAEEPDVPTPRPGTGIVDELPREPGDHVVEKEAASAFFGNDLAQRLRSQGVDTVVHLGCTTSGCVRASVVDAAAHGFKNAVVEEGVFDRALAPHRAGLFDMDAKYADVLTADEAERYIASRARRRT